MYGGRQFLLGLILGGLSYAFLQTAEGRKLISQLSQTLSAMGQDNREIEVVNDSRKSDGDSGKSD